MNAGAELGAGVSPEAGTHGAVFLGDAIAFFLDAKRAGGHGEKTINDYRKKLDLFQRWLALQAGPEEVDALYAFADVDALEAYAVHLRDVRVHVARGQVLRRVSVASDVGGELRFLSPAAHDSR